MLPKRRQLSVSIISLVSIFVISLVIWLILLFFSVTKGLEKNWIEKLIAITAPIRLTPTEKYFSSYYYKIDLLSQKSGYTYKSLQEKLQASTADPYKSNIDEELPRDFPLPDKNTQGEVKDLVKLASQAILSIKGASPFFYAMAPANLKLKLLRGLNTESLTQAELAMSIYLGAFQGDNPSLQKTILALNAADIENSFQLLAVDALENSDDKETIAFLKPSDKKQAQEAFLKNYHLSLQDLEKNPEKTLFSLNQKIYQEKELLPNFSYYKKKNLHQTEYKLPENSLLGYGVLAPKSFKDNGVLVGDRGFLLYYTQTLSALQEMRTPIFIAGFYDPGIVPLGGKFLLADSPLIEMVSALESPEMAAISQGIYVRLKDYAQIEITKKDLVTALTHFKINDYWKVETFREYDYSKDLLQQLRSEKNIFSLISMVIIIVACSNIISMLIILVNDKRLEIGILRSMGASSKSIALIFGFCGLSMGLIGSIMGTALAYFTLKHLEALLYFISKAQGYKAFNPIFYGDNLPNQMDLETLTQVFLATVIVSLLAGLIPAIKACRVKPATILRAE